jgi:hypothetical protein
VARSWSNNVVSGVSRKCSNNSGEVAVCEFNSIEVRYRTVWPALVSSFRASHGWPICQLPAGRPRAGLPDVRTLPLGQLDPWAM